MFRKHKAIDQIRPKIDDLLNSAMRALPGPVVGEEFNQRIHAAMQIGAPKRQNLLAAVRAGGAGLCGSFAITLLMLSLFTGSPRANSVPGSEKLNSAAADYLGRTDNTDSVIERTDLTSASIRFLLIPDAASNAGAIPTKNNTNSMPAAPTILKKQGA